MFDGVDEPCQRPSWNYRKVGGGGLLVDMYSHFRYLIEGVLGPVRRVFTSATTAVPERIDEAGARYAVDVEDQPTTLIELKSGATGVIIASWVTRVRRDDLMTLQIDGTNGSAIAGLHRCCMQPRTDTPRVAAFNPTVDLAVDYRARWQEAPVAGPNLIPTGSAGRISCAISRRTRRCAPTSPPASGMWRSPRPAGAVAATVRGSVLMTLKD